MPSDREVGTRQPCVFAPPWGETTCGLTTHKYLPGTTLLVGGRNQPQGLVTSQVIKLATKTGKYPTGYWGFDSPTWFTPKWGEKEKKMETCKLPENFSGPSTAGSPCPWCTHYEGCRDGTPQCIVGHENYLPWKEGE